MFTKTLFQHDLESQGKILGIISKLVEEEKIKSTESKIYQGLSVKSFTEAHKELEMGKSIGKIIVNY